MRVNICITSFIIMLTIESYAQPDILEIRDSSHNIIELKEEVLNEINDNVFLLAYADKESAKKYDTLTINYDLYTSYTIPKNKNIDAKYSEFTNCKVIDIVEKYKIDFVLTYYDGKKLRMSNIRKVLLKPSEIGELEGTPMELTLPLKYHFEGSGKSDLIFIRIRSNEIRIDVKE